MTEMTARKFMRSATRRWSAIAAAATFACSAACAAPPSPTVTIKFNGRYNPVACTVVDGNENKTVTLPTISTSALTNAGQTAGATAFDISVLCDGYAGNVVTFFENGPTTSENGNLDVEDPSDGQSATGVQIQLVNGDGSPIKVGDVSTMKGVSVQASTPTPIPFFARYYATGKTGAGKVRTYVTFVIQMH
ncbi:MULTISPECIES: fimbrial protein [Burkholderia]|uniref:fimbrial protein n=1 Tax=Burkholderia TaxID=32008 RepID=UPI0009EABE41|nr:MULTISPECIES: fimbrial protein [Burkholderia]